MSKHHLIYSNEVVWRGHIMAGHRAIRWGIYELTAVIAFLFFLHQLSEFNFPTDWKPLLSGGGWNDFVKIWEAFEMGGVQSFVLLIAAITVVTTGIAARRERKAIEAVEEDLGDLMFDD